MIVGDTNETEIINEANKHISNWKKEITPLENISSIQNIETNSSKIVLIDKPNSPQSMLRIGHLTVPFTHSDARTLNVINYILVGNPSSRLFLNLREDKGYSYGYMSSIKWLDGPSPFFAGGSVQTEVTRESLIETFKEFSDIRDKNPVTDTEFNDAVNNVLRGLPSNFETISQLVDQMSNIALYGLPDDYYSHYPQDIAKVKIEDVQRVAHKYMESEPDLILVVGDKVQLDSKLQDLGYEIIHTDNEGRPL